MYICILNKRLKKIFFVLTAGHVLFDIDDGRSADILEPPSVHYTLIFNALTMMTLFNLINARMTEGQRNIFEGTFKSKLNLAWILAFVAQVISFDPTK